MTEYLKTSLDGVKLSSYKVCNESNQETDSTADVNTSLGANTYSSLGLKLRFKSGLALL